MAYSKLLKYIFKPFIETDFCFLTLDLSILLNGNFQSPAFCNDFHVFIKWFFAIPDTGIKSHSIKTKFVYFFNTFNIYTSTGNNFFTTFIDSGPDPVFIKATLESAGE